jgi:hypothetical protein
MAVIQAILLTLMYIKAGAARITAACLAKQGEDANYDHESKAFVLTTVETDGSYTWTGKACGARDTVVRVYAACKSETEWLVYIGAKWQGSRADRHHGGPVLCKSQQEAETLIAGTVYAMSQGMYPAPLASRLPRVFHGRKLVERPDQIKAARKAGNVVTKVTDEAHDAMAAMLAKAEADAANVPADKPKTPDASKANGSK